MSSLPRLEIVKTTVDVGYDVPIEVNITANSGLIYDVQVGMQHQEPVAIKEHLRRVSDFSISLYIYFLRHYPLSVITPDNTSPSETEETDDQLSAYDGQITDRSTMLDCLTIYSLTDDVNFFRFLLQQLFRRWTLLSPVLYSQELPPESKWEIWLNCPYQLLPDIWLNDKSFMASWSARKDNKKVTLNGNELLEYKTEVSSDDSGETDSDQLNEEKSARYYNNTTEEELRLETNTGTKNGRLLYSDIHNHFNHTEHGPSVVEQQENGRSRLYKGFIKDESAGPEKFYTEERLLEESYFVDCRLYGQTRLYYPNGQLHMVRTLVGGIRDGPTLSWYDDVNHTLKKDVNWRHGQLVAASFYNLDGSYIVADILPHTLPRDSVIALTFYGANGKVIRKINRPFTQSKDKYDTHFDAHGNVVQDEPKNPDSVYYIDANTWTLRGSTVIGLVPFY